MPSTILSDNGVSSGSAGLKTTAASDGSLALQTTTAGGTATTAVTIDTSQNVGVGVTPSAWGSIFKAQQIGAGNSFIAGRTDSVAGRQIQIGTNAYYNGTNWIYGISQPAAKYYLNDNTHVWEIAPSGTAGNTISFTQAMTLDASGRLLIGATSQSGGVASRLYIKQTIDSAFYGINLVSAASQEWVGSFAIDSSGNLNFAQSYLGAGSYQGITFTTSGSERLRIDSSGNLLVAGTTVGLGNGGFQVQPAGNGAGIPLVGVGAPSSSNSNLNMAVYSTNLGQYQFYVGMGGTVYARSTSITGLSDQREKENIRALDVGLNEILALQPRRFDWKNGSVSNVAGFVAQEVETVLPDLVEEYKINDDETRLGLKMGDMIPVLVKAIQEQQAIIEQLKARLDAANL